MKAFLTCMIFVSVLLNELPLGLVIHRYVKTIGGILKDSGLLAIFFYFFFNFNIQYGTLHYGE